MRALIVLAVVLAAACADVSTVITTVPPQSPLPAVVMKYRVFEDVGRPWYCDSDFYPIARADERELARQHLPEIRQDGEIYDAILIRVRLSDTPATWTDTQLLAVYRDWKDLRALTLTATGPAGVYGFTFTVRPPDVTTKTGSERVEGRVDTFGRVTVRSRTAAGPLNCPICLADTTRIATPRGPVSVTELRVGDLVWTAGPDGSRVAAPLLEVASVEAPAGHEVLRLTLADGRGVTASPGHPAVDGRALAALAVGGPLDGSTIVTIERLPYSGRTYDLLPAGATGAYWADGVLLGSTLRRD